jgi:hypothetical protein
VTQFDKYDWMILFCAVIAGTIAAVIVSVIIVTTMA